VSNVTAQALHLLLPPVSPAAPGTLYEQLVSGFTRVISDGHLKPGDPLPSVRQLAEQMLVSVITVKRAYEELERDGIVYSRQGLGTFVAEGGIDRNRESKLTRANELLREAAREAREAGLKPSEVRRLFLRSLDGAS
jgi:GntR family transcriptional regulator